MTSLTNLKEFKPIKYYKYLMSIYYKYFSLFQLGKYCSFKKRTSSINECAELNNFWKRKCKNLKQYTHFGQSLMV